MSTSQQPERPPPVNDPALPLRSEVRFRQDYRCFIAGQVLTFDRGVNLLVGEQGCGKSTLISLLRDLVGTKFAVERARRVIDVVMQACYMRWFDFDEPDMALSIRSVNHLADLLRRAADGGHQVIAAVHNPIVIASQPQVLSLEQGAWMSSERFIALESQPRQ